MGIPLSNANIQISKCTAIINVVTWNYVRIRMFNVFTESSSLDAIISFCVREHRLALAPITTQRNALCA